MPKYTIAALVYRSTVFADWVYGSVHKYTPQLATGEAEFLFVANDASDRVLAHLRDRDYPHVVHTNPPWTEAEHAAAGFAYPLYKFGEYRAWNRAIVEAKGQYVCLVNSDHYFSPGWFDALAAHAAPNLVVCSQLVEPGHPRYGRFYLALDGQFGRTPAAFDEAGWLDFCAARRGRGLRVLGAYMPCLIHRQAAMDAGLYPEGNLWRADGGLLPGDEQFFHRLAEAGVVHVTANGSLVYHLKEGEKDE